MLLPWLRLSLVILDGLEYLSAERLIFPADDLCRAIMESVSCVHHVNLYGLLSATRVQVLLQSSF